jgi:hypothetical protein
MTSWPHCLGMPHTNAPSEPGPVLLSDARVAAVPVRDSGEPLTELDESSYAGELRVFHLEAGEAELERLTSRFVAPITMAPHVAGAAVDLTLVDSGGRELDLGTPVDATVGRDQAAR